LAIGEVVELGATRQGREETDLEPRVLAAAAPIAISTSAAGLPATPRSTAIVPIVAAATIPAPAIVPPLTASTVIAARTTSAVSVVAVRLATSRRLGFRRLGFRLAIGVGSGRGLTCDLDRRRPIIGALGLFLPTATTSLLLRARLSLGTRCLGAGAGRDGRARLVAGGAAYRGRLGLFGRRRVAADLIGHGGSIRPAWVRVQPRPRRETRRDAPPPACSGGRAGIRTAHDAFTANPAARHARPASGMNANSRG